MYFVVCLRVFMCFFFFFQQKTAYEMRISDWSSDVCSSDLDLLGFEITTWYGEDAAFISAGGYHHHIGLNTWYSKNADPAPVHAAGLFHTAIVYPERKDLAFILNRIRKTGYPLTGASDHGVSEALYLNDPDENGVDLYWDRDRKRTRLNSSQ